MFWVFYYVYAWRRTRADHGTCGEWDRWFSFQRYTHKIDIIVVSTTLRLKILSNLIFSLHRNFIIHHLSSLHRVSASTTHCRATPRPATCISNIGFFRYALTRIVSKPIAIYLWFPFLSSNQIYSELFSLKLKPNLTFV